MQGREGGDATWGQESRNLLKSFFQSENYFNLRQIPGTYVPVLIGSVRGLPPGESSSSRSRRGLFWSTLKRYRLDKDADTVHTCAYGVGGFGIMQIDMTVPRK